MKDLTTTAQLVREEINSSIYLKETLKKGLINYSELARQLLPKIKKHNKKANIASIIITLQRYYDSLKEKKSETEKFIESQMPKVELSIKNKIITYSYERNKKVADTITNISKEIKWGSGDMMFSIQGSSEITIIIDQKHEDKFNSIKKYLIEKKEDLATLSVREPEGIIYSKEVPGFLAILCSTLADNNVNIYECATTFKQIIFVLHKDQVLKAYEVFNKLAEHYKK